MTNPNIRIKRSAVAGKRPEISQVDMGELALNTNDGRLFTRKYNVGIGSTVTLLNVWTENIGGGAYYNEGNIGIGTDNPTSKLTIIGDEFVSGILTASEIVASTANIETLDTTTAEIDFLTNTNLNTTGIATISNLNVDDGFDVYANASVFHQNVVIQGNLTVNGTEVILNVDEKYIKDKQIVLGFSTTNNVDDTTANGGGLGIASTEGSPLVCLQCTGINTLPSTYKQLIWTKANTFGAGTTDAFLFNYAVGIGSTLVPNGVRLSVGGIHFTDNNVTASTFTGSGANLTSLNASNISSGTLNNLRLPQNISVSGIVTATTFVGNLQNTLTLNTSGTGLSGSTTFNNSGAATFTVTSNATSVNTNNTIVSRNGSGGFSAGIITATSFVGPLSGTATSTTNIPNLTGAITSVNTTTSLGSFTSANLSTALTDKTGTGVNVFATSPTLVTPVLGSASATSIVVSSGSTFTNGPILVGSATSTGTASQRLQITGGAYISDNVGIGLTNSEYALHVDGETRIGNQTSGSGGWLRVSLRDGTAAPAAATISLRSTASSSEVIPVTQPNLILSRGSDTLGTLLQFKNNRTGYAAVGSLATGDNQHDFRIYTGIGTEVIRVDNNGNLGINTTNPTSKLDVTGDVRITGVVTATTFFGSLSGTATSTTNIPNLSGDISSANTVTTLATVNSNVGTFGGTGAIPVVTVNGKGLVTGISTVAPNNGTLTLAVSGTGLSGSASFTANQSGASTFTVTSNATSANTNNTIVARDGSGNFSAGTITANLTGTATSTTNIPNLTGAITSVNTTTSLGSFTSANLAAALTDETGSGANVFATSPTLVTPILGTPTSGTLTNCTGLPVSTGISGLGANVATFLATPSSANLASAVTDETGTGVLVFATSPTLVTPVLGAATATSINASGAITANSYNVGADVGISTTRTTVATTAATTIDSFAIATFRSARVQVQITQGTNYQTSDVLIIHNGTTANIVEYGSIATNDYLGTFSSTVSGGNCLLQINMSSATSSTVKVLSQRITV
jgi:hypothetical protein